MPWTDVHITFSSHSCMIAMMLLSSENTPGPVMRGIQLPDSVVLTLYLGRFKY